MIQLKNLTKILTIKNNFEKIILDNINLHINHGDIFGIMGKSGAGKSTLLRSINLLETPTSGQVIVDGLNLTKLKEPQLRGARRCIGMIFQDFHLLQNLTAGKNIALPLTVHREKKEAIRDRVHELARVVGLSKELEKYPWELSGGQKQRVAIARALATRPKVLLCDEATSALDVETTQSILDLLSEINRIYQVTIVLVTHEISVVKYICNQVAIVDQGCVVEMASRQSFFQNPSSALGQSFVQRASCGF